MNQTNTSERAQQLIREHELAWHRANLATSDPESYTTKEMLQAHEELMRTTAAIDSAMRERFAALPPEAKPRMLDLLGASGVEDREWWERILLNFDALPDSPPAAV